MRTTDLSTKDYDIEVYFGDIKYKDTPRKESYGYVKYLYTDLTDIRKYYIRLGFHLAEFAYHMFYTDFGFATLEDFCQVNLGLDKSAVSRCIGVYREFNASNTKSQNKGCAMELSEEYKDYSYTQLCEMLPLSPEERKNITPDMTIKQIRDYKKSLKAKKIDYKQIDNLVASTQLTEPEVETVASTQQEDVVFYDPDEYLKKSGFMRCNYVRKCSPLASGARNSLNIFDIRGKKVLMDAECDVLMNADGEIVLRLSAPYDTAEPVKNLICI